MPAGIQGKVFNDLNHNGRWAAGEPGIPDNYIVLEYPDGTFSKTSSDSLGDYFFTGITLPGTYKLYNVYADPGTVTIPPMEASFPPGMNGLTGWRRWDLNITQTQVNNGTTIVDANNSATSTNNRTYFGYDYQDPFDTPYGIVFTTGGSLILVDVATGDEFTPGINVGTINGIGFGTTDNFVYGAYDLAIARASPHDGGVQVQYPLPPGGVSHNGGDTDGQGHLYINPAGGFCCYDINPYRTTFGRALDSTNNFAEITSGSAKLAYLNADASGVVGAECLYRYQDNRIYSPSGTFSYWLDPFTGNGGRVPIVGSSVNLAGVAFLDNVGNAYIGGQANALRFDPTTLPTQAISFPFPTISASTGDGARNGYLPIYFAIPDTTKSVDKTNAKLGDTITYTLEITNTGNIDANILSVIDTIPVGTSFIDDSLTLNGITVPGANVAPPLGFSDPGTIPVDGIATVTFQVLVESIPQDSITLPNKAQSTFEFIDTQTSLPYSQSLVSNTVNTRVISADFTVDKIVDKTNVILGDTITYTVSFINEGNIEALDVYFKDTIPVGTTLVADSVTVDGVSRAGESPMPPTGVSLLTIPIGVLMTVTFIVLVETLPVAPYSIPNIAYLDYYVEDPVSGATIPDAKYSNEVVSNIIVVDLGNTNKIVDKEFTTNGDEIEYTIVIPNTGNTTANNVIFKDTIPNGTTFIDNSVTVDGVASSENPETGINIGSILANQVVTIKFKVKVI